MITKRWYAVLAAVLVAVAALVPAASASASTSCPAALVIGLHGANEGPSSPTGTNKSATIGAVFTAFTNEVKKLPNDGTSHSANLHWFPYPVVSYKDLTSSAGLGKAVVTVAAAAGQLYKYVSQQAAACPGTHIAIAGYSMGAWVINYALTNYYYMAGLFDLALFMGDPCWDHVGDGSQGLAQRAEQTTHAQLGCMGDTYPYIGFANPYTAQALCYNDDPICGEGYNLLTAPEQFAKAYACSPADGCPHFLYYKDGAAAEGGKWLADNVF